MIKSATASSSSAPAAPLTATIDDRAVTIRPGETILAAAARVGVEIPTLCHSPGLAPEGGCRICMVEIEGQRTQAACHTPITNGMRVRTESPHLTALRREILHLTISANPRGALRPRVDGTAMERLLARYGVESSDFGHHASSRPVDASHPTMRFDRDRCITCRACLHACEEVQGQFVYGIEGRGGASHLIFGATDRFAESGCVSCGACVDRCPTGAITDRDRIDRRGAHPPVETTDSVCGYCGVGCRIRSDSDGSVVLSIAGVSDAAVNHGHLCVKGRYNHTHHRAADRLTTPLLRDAHGALRPASWDEAIRYTATRLLELRNRHGADALGTMTSSRSTNEAAYLLQKLFRSIVGTNNTDCCARICHSSTAIALGLVTGTGAATASYDDLDEANLIVVAGANPTEAHPVVGARIKQAALRGAALVVIDPRDIELAAFAGVHLRLWPGTNVPLFHAIAKIMVEEKLYDAAYVAERCEGFEEFVRYLSQHSLEEYERITHVPVETIRAAARLIASRGPGLFVSGLGLSEQTQGVAGVMGYCNLGLLTGSLGKRGAGMLPLRGQNNVQGNADMGSQPYALTGYATLSDEAARERCRLEWGSAPPREAGKTIPEMYDAAIAGSLKALWIQGEDVAQSDPNHEHVMKALRALDLLIVQELFMTETASVAHVVFPAAASLEQEGTFTNGERRVQHVRPSVPPPSGARPDWEVIRDVGRAMGAPWRYETPATVMDEIARVAPGLFGGISYGRLEGDGVQWPCPTSDHPGTRTVHAQGFVRGKALFTTVDFVPPQDATDAEHPLILITGRVLEHYNVGTMTRRGPSLELVGHDYLEIHPEDATRLGIAEGSTVAVRSRFGEAKAPARITRRVMPGTLFLSFHFPETGTNSVVGPYTDPKSKCPDYKVVAVRVAPVR